MMLVQHRRSASYKCLYSAMIFLSEVSKFEDESDSEIRNFINPPLYEVSKSEDRSGLEIQNFINPPLYEFSKFEDTSLIQKLKFRKPSPLRTFKI